MSQRTRILEMMNARALAESEVARERARGQRDGANAAAWGDVTNKAIQTGLGYVPKLVDTYQQGILEAADAGIKAGAGLPPLPTTEPKVPEQSKSRGLPKLSMADTVKPVAAEAAVASNVNARRLGIPDRMASSDNQLHDSDTERDETMRWLRNQEKKPTSALLSEAGISTRGNPLAGPEAPAMGSPTERKKEIGSASPMLDRIRAQNEERAAPETKVGAPRVNARRPAFSYTKAPDNVADDLLHEQGLNTGSLFYNGLKAKIAGRVNTARRDEEDRQIKRYDGEIDRDLKRLQQTLLLDGGGYDLEKRVALDRMDPAVLAEIANLKGAEKDKALDVYSKHLTDTMYADGEIPRTIGPEQLRGMVSQFTRKQSLQDISNELAAARIGAKGKKGGGKSAPKLTSGQVNDIASATSTIEVLDDIDKKQGLLPGGKLSNFAERSKQFLGLSEADKVAYRAEIDRQISAYLKFLSGAGVTESEYNRVVAASPNSSDTADQFVKKLQDFRREIMQRRNNLLKTAESAGYDIGALDYRIPAGDRAQEMKQEDPNATDEELLQRLREEGY